MVVLVVVGAGAAVAGAVALLARRWPAIEAPRISGEKLAEEVEQHPKLAGHLRRHFNPKTETGIALIVATAIVGGAEVVLAAASGGDVGGAPAVRAMPAGAPKPAGVAGVVAVGATDVAAAVLAGTEPGTLEPGTVELVSSGGAAQAKTGRSVTMPATSTLV